MNYIFYKKSIVTPENIVSQDIETYDCGGSIVPIIISIESLFVNDYGNLLVETLEFDFHKKDQFLLIKNISSYVGKKIAYTEIYHHNGNVREEVHYNDGNVETIHVCNKKGKRIAEFTINSRGVRLFEKSIEVDPNNYEKYLFSESHVNLIPDLL